MHVDHDDRPPSSASRQLPVVPRAAGCLGDSVAGGAPPERLRLLRTLALAGGLSDLARSETRSRPGLAASGLAGVRTRGLPVANRVLFRLSYEPGRVSGPVNRIRVTRQRGRFRTGVP